MKKIICGREYNTQTAELIKKCAYGCYGDPSGYEEILYRTPEGLYFLYFRGGENAPFPGEEIQRLAKTKVEQWLNNH